MLAAAHAQEDARQTQRVRETLDGHAHALDESGHVDVGVVIAII